MAGMGAQEAEEGVLPRWSIISSSLPRTVQQRRFQTFWMHSDPSDCPCHSHVGMNQSSPHWLISANKCYRIKPKKDLCVFWRGNHDLDGCFVDLDAFLSNYSLSVTDFTASLQASLWFLYSLRSTLHPGPNHSLSCSITTFFSTQLTNSNRCFGSFVVRRRVCVLIFQSTHVEQKGHFRKVKLSWKSVTGLPLWLLMMFNGSS